MKVRMNGVQNMRKGIAFILTFLLCIGLCACGQKESKNIREAQIVVPEKIGNLKHVRAANLKYATEFALDYYQNEETKEEYPLISIKGESSYLVVPEGQKNLDDVVVSSARNQDMVVIVKPQKIYLVASQVMDMIVELGATEQLKFSAFDQDSWYAQEPKQLMKEGKLIYAGKYSAPDYETLLENGCDLAIENTMIYHSPDVKEKLESFGIPVLVDHSSYEQHPLGRMEWVKMYGAVLGREESAEEVFGEQVRECNSLAVDLTKEERPSVAFFYIAANGNVKVRKTADYVPKMIKMAGGRYCFEHLGEEDDNASSTVNMQMEEFYDHVKDVDYIIYNSTIEGELTSIAELVGKCDLLRNVKAVQEGNVFCTTANMYQSTMETGTIIADIYKMLNQDDTMTYLFRLE